MRGSHLFVIMQSVTRILSQVQRGLPSQWKEQKTMRTKLTLFAAVCVAALALSTPASATTIFQFSQSNSTDFISAAVVGSTTTLTTHGSVAPGNSIPINISQEGVSTIPVTGFETFTGTGLVSTLASFNAGGSQVNQDGFIGTVVFSTGPNGTGNVYLTATISNGTLSANGASGAINASNGSTNTGGTVSVTLTSIDPNITPLLGPGGTSLGAVALALINVTPSQSGSGFRSFGAQTQGSVSTVLAVPEPASFLSAGTAILAGLGCFGWSRRKSSKA